jgi:predicted O-methyltransferase YrrM
MRDIYMPISREVGRLLYVLARSRRATTIVEFGDALASYLAYVRRPDRGYVSVEVPLGDRIEISLRG